MTEANSEYKDTAQIMALDEDQRMKYLLEQWSMTDKVIVGTLQQRGELWWLTQVTDIEGRRLEYPISDFPERATQLRAGRGIRPVRNVFSAPRANGAVRRWHKRSGRG
ncbi:hypothetical protein, partial [uncultured Thiodictyon sp.]|uniref:hypothetical protein n=1 Tax=uncultured Thiodictyon sp. TaxID=1846217 RepID=UPI0025EA09CF